MLRDARVDSPPSRRSQRHAVAAGAGRREGAFRGVVSQIVCRVGKAPKARAHAFSRHCEERSDEAIQGLMCCPGLLRFARNDAWARRFAPLPTLLSLSRGMTKRGRSLAFCQPAQKLEQDAAALAADAPDHAGFELVDHRIEP